MRLKFLEDIPEEDVLDDPTAERHSRSIKTETLIIFDPSTRKLNTHPPHHHHHHLFKLL